MNMTGLEDLKIYQLAENLEMQAHELTKTFPVDEKYRTVDQVRRSSSSARSNIAEGYGRYTYGDKLHHFHIARSEAEETKRHLIMAKKKGFCSADKVDPSIEGYTELLKGINGYIRFLRKQQTGNQVSGNQVSGRQLAGAVKNPETRLPRP